jgi:protein-S-isoprenylcysteine O-methyltransferase Ste14
VGPVRASIDQGESHVITLGVLLLILGFVFSINILWTLGIILIVIGVILFILGAMGRAVGGRPHYW